MKKTTHTLRALTIAVALALFTTACSNEDMVVEEQPSETPGVKASVEAPVYHFSIPASFSSGGQTRAMEIGEDNIIHTFATTDKVYVYIQRADDDGDGTIAVAHDGIKTATYLVPAEIDGAKCTLEGELRFYCNDDDDNNDGDRFVPFEPAVDDVVYMFYNMNSPVEDSPGNLHLSYYDYTFQNGSKDHDIYGQFGDTEFLMSRGAAKHDFAMAKMKVTGVDGNGTDGYSLSMVQYEDGTKSDVHFENLAAMVRQRLSFKDKDGEDMNKIPNIEALTLSFEGGDYFVGYVWPMNPNGAYYVAPKLSISDPVISAKGDVYLALPIYDDNCNLPLVLEARDSKGNIYSVTKAAPEGGFKNGKYYYGEMTLAWQKSI